MRGYAAAKRGDRAGALRALAATDNAPIVLVAEALAYSALGERDRAARALIEALEQGAEGASYLGLIEPDLFNDPRVREARRRLGMR